jgi:peptide deformylase
VNIIVKDEAVLRLPSEPVRDIREGGVISRKLQSVLERNNTKAVKQARFGKPRTVGYGIGLSAPQIGIHKQVAVVISKGRPIVLMNPVITAHSETKVPVDEGCLSFPGRVLKVWRYDWVEVRALNHAIPLKLGMVPAQGELVLPDEAAARLLLAIAVQHEVTHLHGLLFSDFTSKDYPPPSEWPGWLAKERAAA